MPISRQSSLSYRGAATDFIRISFELQRDHTTEMTTSSGDTSKLAMLTRSANAGLKNTGILMAVDLNANSTQLFISPLKLILIHDCVCRPQLSLIRSDRQRKL